MTNPEISGESTEKLIVVPQDIDFNTLVEKLAGAHVPIEKYGQGAAKTIGHLLLEVNEGESVLTLDEKGKIYREVNVLWVDVVCSLANGDVYLLKEDRQEFKDGRVKVRNIDSSIGEKLKPSEDAGEGVVRALQEELDVSEVSGLYEVGYQERTFIPDTFPGIESTYKMHKFVSIIPEAAFVPEGYIETQSDKTNYYTWELIHKDKI